jgi:hypothetical protein
LGADLGAVDARCAAHGSVLLGHDTTAYVASELNLLREAARDPVLNYYGESVGTLLGAIYAYPFPGTTGRVILDRNIRYRGLDQDRGRGCRPGCA